MPARCVVCVAVSAAALRSLLLLPKPLATAARAEPSSNFVVHERALALSAASAAARSRAHAVCDFTYCCCSSSSSCCCCFQFVCALTCLPVWAAPRLALCKRALSLSRSLSLASSLTHYALWHTLTLLRCCCRSRRRCLRRCCRRLRSALGFSLFIQPTDTVCGHYFPKRSQPHNTHTRARTHARRRHYTHTHLRREQQQQQRRSSHRAHIHGVCAP